MSDYAYGLLNIAKKCLIKDRAYEKKHYTSGKIIHPFEYQVIYNNMSSHFNEYYDKYLIMSFQQDYDILLDKIESDLLSIRSKYDSDLDCDIRFNLISNKIHDIYTTIGTLLYSVNMYDFHIYKKIQEYLYKELC